MSAPTLRERLERMQLLEPVEAIARKHGVTVEELEGSRRFPSVVNARHEAMLFLRAQNDLEGAPHFSTTALGQLFGNRDHSTVLHALKSARKRVGPLAYQPTKGGLTRGPSSPAFAFEGDLDVDAVPRRAWNTVAQLEAAEPSADEIRVALVVIPETPPALLGVPWVTG